MKFIVWLIRVLVFVLLLVLALSNTQTATLNFLAGYAWSAPLILIGLAFFVVGFWRGLCRRYRRWSGCGSRTAVSSASCAWHARRLWWSKPRRCRR